MVENLCKTYGDVLLTEEEEESKEMKEYYAFPTIAQLTRDPAEKVESTLRGD